LVGEVVKPRYQFCKNSSEVIVYGFPIILIGLVLDLIAFAIHLKTGIKMREGFSITALFFGFWLMGLMFKFQLTGKLSAESVGGELEERFNLLCSRLKQAGLTLRVGDRKKVSGSTLRNEVFITEPTIKGLSGAGVDFIVGHELAHRKLAATNLNPPPKRIAMLAILWLLVPMFALRLDISFWYYMPIFVPPFALMMLMLYKYPNSVSAAGPDLELACDYLSLKVIDDRSGAIEALSALSHGSKLDRKVFGYPSKETRIEQVEQFLAGSDRTPSKNKFVEDTMRVILADLDASKLTVPQ
jgi:Zn-dependent protease with chaperone function